MLSKYALKARLLDTEAISHLLFSFLKDIESAAAIRWHLYEQMDSATWPGSV